MINDYLKSGKYEEAKQSVDIIQRSAGDITNNLSDLVWTINPQRDSMQTLLERLEEYAKNMCALKNMNTKVNVSESVYEHNLPMENRRNILSLLQRGHQQCVKYSNGTLLELNIKESNGCLNFL
jgi:signal transduction histidine kinase